MKRKLYMLCLLLAVMGVNRAWGQCSGGTSAGAVTPTLAFQTVGMSTGTYRTFAATAGNSYQFTFCQGGGSAGFDSQLTILDNAGTFAGGYSDDVCGSASELTWNCPLTGTYRVLVNDYYCLGSGTAATLAYRMFVPGPGATCANPHNIAALPFTATGLTTCGAGNDYTSANACLSSYMNGEDYVFRYVAAGPQTLRITLTNTLTFTGVFVVQNCPNSGSAVCISPAATGCSGTPSNTSSGGNPTADFALPGAGTYFIIVDTWPSPACTGFDINIQNVPSSSSGPGCGAYTITTPAYNPDNFNTGTALVFPDDQFSAAVPIPFEFCFMGTKYTSLIVSSNVYVSFNTACATQTSRWDTDVIPSPANVNSPEARNSVMFPWVDVDPGVGGTIKYNVAGTAPNRRFVLSFRNVPMFSTTCNPQLYTGQVMLYETSWVIDIYIANLPNCPTWNNGEAVLGLLDASGTVAVPVPGFNNTVYSLSNFARRFTPNCPTCTILPVSFAELSGRHDLLGNVVTWTTGHEVHSASFTLERSRDGQNFEPVSTVEGAGDEPNGRRYEVLDRDRYATTFYRVVQRDHDGLETVSDVIMVAADAQALAITNLSVQGTQLQVDLQSAANEGVEIALLDVLGKTVDREQASLAEGGNRQLLDISGLAPGVYFVKVTNAHGGSAMRKFVRP